MTLSWAQLDSEDVPVAWQRVVAASPHATFFHTPLWGELLERTVPGWQPDAIAIEFSDGMLAVLPMMRHADSGHRESMAPYVYGGPLFSADPTESHLDEIGRIPRWFEDIVLYSNPFAPFAWQQEGLVRWRIHTHVVDLSPGFDVIHAAFRRATRQQCRQAEEGGIEVSVARQVHEVDQYYDAYVDSLNRWGEAATSFYPRELFHGLFELQQLERGVRIWVGKVNGQVVSGVAVLYQGQHAVAWHSSTHADYLRSHASPLIHMTAIRAACEDGLRWYDFNPSGKLRGVEWFKEGFATERRRFDMYASPTATEPAIGMTAVSTGAEA